MAVFCKNLEFFCLTRYCDDMSEVENVYIAYNFSHFLIYQPKVIKIDEILTKF